MAALGVLFLAVGAILAFAVEVSVAGVDLDAVGWILMIVGAIALLAGMLTERGLWGWRTRSERQVSPDGRTVYEQHDSRSF